jgi:KDEL-tailed cysteine endopeptidase
MKLIFLFAAMMVGTMATIQPLSSVPPLEFDEWCNACDKHYHPLKEYQSKRIQYQNITNSLHFHNMREDSTYVVDTRSCRYLDEPRAKGYNGHMNMNKNANDNYSHNLPERWDWREHGYVGPVYDQGQCGSCWAFSVKQVFEFNYVKMFPKQALVPMSAEELVDCDTVDMGCSGGWPYKAANWLLNNTGGMVSSANYPYIASSGMGQPCNCTVVQQDTLPFKGYKVLTGGGGNETTLLRWSANSVVSIAVDASGQGFGYYIRGIYNGMFNGGQDCNSQMLDHAINVVGYNTFSLNDNLYDVWIVKNSWADVWGDVGYIYMTRGSNVCGIAEDYFVLSR